MLFEVNPQRCRLQDNLAAWIPFLSSISHMGIFPLRSKSGVAAIVNVIFLHVILTRVLKIESLLRIHCSRDGKCVASIITAAFRPVTDIAKWSRHSFSLSPDEALESLSKQPQIDYSWHQLKPICHSVYNHSSWQLNRIGQESVLRWCAAGAWLHLYPVRSCLHHLLALYPGLNLSLPLHKMGEIIIPIS